MTVSPKDSEPNDRIFSTNTTPLDDIKPFAGILLNVLSLVVLI
jgi:hypothetical protein